MRNARSGRAPERVLDLVRGSTRRADAALAALRALRAVRGAHTHDAPAGRVRIDGPHGLVVERSGVLTPYVLETVCDDARRIGAGATLTIALDAMTTDEQIAGLRTRLGGVERRGVAVHVARRADGPGAA